MAANVEGTLMNNLVKKMLIFLLVMGVVAAGGWYGRKAYKNAMENHAVTDARQYLAKKDVRNASLCLQRALQINPLSLPAAQIMADMLDAVGVPAALSWRIHVSQLQPQNMTNRLLWAETAIKLKDLKSAAAALDGVDEKTKSSAMYLKLAGAMEWNLGKADEAQKYYRQALKLEPKNPAIIMNLDTIGLASTNSEVAAAARASMEQLSTNADYRMLSLRYLAADAGTHKSYAKAVNYSAEIVRDPAATVSDKIEYLELLHLAGNTNFAPWLASLKQAAIKSSEQAFALGKWMLVTDNATNALRWLQTLPPTVQTNQPVPLIIADCLVAQKDWKGLNSLLEKQDWAEADCFRLALVSFGQRSLQQESISQTTWHKALRLSSHRLDRLARLAQVTANWNWDAENTEVLKEITAEFPKEKWATDLLVNKYYAKGDTRDLGDLVAKIYAADPSNPKSKNNLANISLLRKADLDEAYRLAREAYDNQPDNPFFISTYGYSLLMQKKQDEALKVVNSLKPEYLKIPSIAAYYGVVEARAGHKDVAKAPLERAAAAKLLPEEKELVRLAMTSP
jgi:Tfp pilus assembly protein PilF